MAAGYSGKENDHLEQALDANIAQLVQLLETNYLSNNEVYKPVDLAPKIQYFTLDVISDIAFGKSFGNLEADQDVSSYIKTVEEAFSLAVVLATFPGLCKLLFLRIFKRFWPKDKDKDGVGKLMGIAKGSAAIASVQTKRLVATCSAPLSTTASRSERLNPKPLSQIFAGTETSAIAIRTTLLYISTNPHIYNALLSELSHAKISYPITDSEARQLPYLQAVVKEGLKMFPPVTGIGFKAVPKGGDTLKGLYVLEGTGIGWSPCGLMRNEAIWGADAKMFRLRGGWRAVKR